MPECRLQWYLKVPALVKVREKAVPGLTVLFHRPVFEVVVWVKSVA
jgi:hypothetical protein